LENLELHYSELYNKIMNLYFDWKINIDIFGNKENEEVLNYFSGSTFAYFQIKVNNDLILSFVKLVDPYRMGSNKNLTLYTLLDDFKNDEIKYFLLKEKLETIKKELEDLKRHRSKIIAHSDYKKALLNGPKGIILGQALVDKIFELIKSFMDIIQEENKTFEKLNYQIGFDIGNHNDMISKMKRYKNIIENKI